MAVIREILLRDEEIVGQVLPVANRVGTLFLNLVSLASLSNCGYRRVQNVRHWRILPWSYWLLLFIYTDSLLFVISTALINNVGINTSSSICQAGILVCKKVPAARSLPRN